MEKLGLCPHPRSPWLSFPVKAPGCPQAPEHSLPHVPHRTPAGCVGRRGREWGGNRGSMRGSGKPSHCLPALCHLPGMQGGSRVVSSSALLLPGVLSPPSAVSNPSPPSHFSLPCLDHPSLSLRPLCHFLDFLNPFSLFPSSSAPPTTPPPAPFHAAQTVLKWLWMTSSHPH